MRWLGILLAGGWFTLSLWVTTPVWAAPVPDPADGPAHPKPWAYSAQLPGGPFETGDTPATPAPGGFLTLPFAHARFVTSIFDHCKPDYSYDNRICRYDGTVAARASGIDPDFGGGYAATPGGSDYLYYEGHDGFDYGLYYENVLAAADGVVTYAGWDKPGCETCGYGRNIFIRHGGGLLTRYGHLDSIAVVKGQAVRRGQVIATSGNSGSSTGAHLHFGVYHEAGLVPLDPYGWAGSGPDPWAHDAGNLWLGGAPRFPDVARPTASVTAVRDPLDPDLLDVAWQGANASSYDLEVVADDSSPQLMLHATGLGSSQYRGATGHRYWFLLTVHNDLGWMGAAASPPVLLPRSRLQP